MEAAVTVSRESDILGHPRPCSSEQTTWKRPYYYNMYLTGPPPVLGKVVWQL